MFSYFSQTGFVVIFESSLTSKYVNAKNSFAGLRKVTDDMKTKNRADRSGIVGVSDKGGRANSPSFSRAGPPKLELQMGRK